MHCKQRFAVVVQQIQANILAQLGSNPFQPHLGATDDPTTPAVEQQKNAFVERKTVLFCCPKIQGTGSPGWKFAN